MENLVPDIGVRDIVTATIGGQAMSLARKDAWKHSRFNHGNHRCIGAPLAMQELRSFHEEWLIPIPDFRLDPDEPPMPATGIVHVVGKLPLLWDSA